MDEETKKKLIEKTVGEDDPNDPEADGQSGAEDKGGQSDKQVKTVEQTATTKNIVDQAVKQIVSALAEAKGIKTVTPSDEAFVRSKIFADGNLREVQYPSDVKSLSKDEKIVFFFKSLLYANRDHASGQVLRALVEGTDAQGGYLVPEELRAEVFRVLPDYAVMRKIARVIPMATNSLKLNSLAAKPSAYWTAEYASKSTTSAELGQVELVPNDLVCLLPVTEQLLADANISLVQFIVQLFAEAIGAAEDKAFFTGSGTGQPRGIDAESLTTVDAGNAGNFDDVIELIYSVPQRARTSKNAAFVANQRGIYNLRKVKDTNGQYIWSPGNPDNGEPERLYGRPLYENNDIAHNKVFFGDWAFYIIGDRQQISVATTTEGGDAWRRNAVEIKAVSRVDGRAVITSPFAEINNL